MAVKRSDLGNRERHDILRLDSIECPLQMDCFATCLPIHLQRHIDQISHPSRCVHFSVLYAQHTQVIRSASCFSDSKTPALLAMNSCPAQNGIDHDNKLGKVAMNGHLWCVHFFGSSLLLPFSDQVKASLKQPRSLSRRHRFRWLMSQWKALIEVVQSLRGSCKTVAYSQRYEGSNFP